MIRAALASLALLLASCGSAHAPPRRTGHSVARMPSGMQVIAVTRETPGVVHLALWIDAGSRDADPPQVSVVAAWAAAARAGDSARGRVVPDGTVIEVPCGAANLEACIEGLGRALSTRAVDPEQLSRLRAKLRRVRRAALADDARRADRLALRALLGDEAAPLFPLGASDDDERVDPASVHSFLEDHYGMNRALLVGAGDVDTADLEQAVEQTFRALTARQARDERDLPEGRGAAMVEAGGGTHVSVASMAHDLPTAAAMARALVMGGPADPSEPLSVVQAHAVPIRGGALVLARAQGGGVEALSRGLLMGLAPAFAQGGGSQVEAAEETAAQTTERIGLAWVADEGEPMGERSAAVGAVVTSGPAEEPDVEALAEQLDAIRERMSERRRVRGEFTDRRASVVTPNGTRIEVHRRDSPGMAIALLYGGGSSREPPHMHGRAALAAQVLTSCAELTAGDGAHARPVVRPELWGVVVSAPHRAWRKALDAVLRCGTRATITRIQVEDARLTLLGHLHQQRASEAAVARALSPSTPGWIAPDGSIDTLPNISVRALTREVGAARVGARLSVAVEGRLPVAASVGRIASWTAALPSGHMAPGRAEARVARRGRDHGAAMAEGEALFVAAWRDPTAREQAAADGPRGLAAAAGAHLAATSQLSIAWTGGDVGAWGAWAAIAIRVPAGDVAAVRHQARNLGHALTDASLTAAIAAQTRTRAWREAHPRHAAVRLATTRLTGADPAANSPTAQLALARQLLARPPVWERVEPSAAR